MASGRFSGKSVLVTGAANGIGLAYAEAFAGEGASVAGRLTRAMAVNVDVADEPWSFVTGLTVTVDGGFVKRL